MIKVILDPYNLRKDDSKWIVTKVSEYPPFCLRIRELIHQKKKETVILKNKVISKWVEDLRRYPKEIITLEDYGDLRKRLMKKLCVNILPNKLTDEIIGELGLLEREPSTFKDTVENWLLETCIDPCWTIDSPSWDHLKSMVNFYLKQDMVNLHPYLSDLLKKKQTLWISSSVGKVKDSYKWFFENPVNNSKTLLILDLIRDYPNDFRDEVSLRYNLGLSSIIGHLEDILERVTLLESNGEVIEYLNDQVMIYWKKILEEKEINLSAIISQISGRLEKEVEILYKYLHENPETCKPHLLRVMKLKFENLLYFQKIHPSLQRLIAPEYPSPPNPAWVWKEWSRWAVNEYLPYRFWQEKNGVIDEKIDEFSLVYQDWLYENYPQLKERLKPLIYGTFSRIDEALKKGYLVIWLILDNLSWEHVRLLINEFEKQNISLDGNPKLQISMLPSETSFSKRAIVSGRLSSQIDEKDKYDDLLSKCWEGKTNFIIANINQLEEKTGLNNYDLCLVLYNRLDEIAHKPEGKIDDREEEVRNRLSFVTRKVGEYIGKVKSPERIKIMVSTDHGSARLLGNAKRFNILKGFIVDETSVKHGRFVKITSEEAIKTGDWYVLDPERFGLGEKYAIPKGYGYIGKKPSGYTHGGLSPEETIVPFLSFSQRIPIKPKGLNIIYKGEAIFKGRPQQIKFTVKNPNEVEVENVRLEILKYDHSFKTISSIERFGQEETIPISIELNPKEKVEDGLVSIDTLVSFTAYGKEWVKGTKIWVKVREIMKVEKDFAQMLEI